MKKPLAFFFAMVGMILLASIGLSISLNHPIWIGITSFGSILWIGLGFVIKARTRKKQLYAKTNL
jgi:hypothetical protein